MTTITELKQANKEIREAIKTKKTELKTFIQNAHNRITANKVAIAGYKVARKTETAEERAAKKAERLKAKNDRILAQCAKRGYTPEQLARLKEIIYNPQKA
jgi:GH15 family glucan-1,4-alpha-glucosidase